VLVTGRLLVELEPYLYSPGYGELRQAVRVVARGGCELPARVWTAVLWE
jgi:hypothetical protein